MNIDSLTKSVTDDIASGQIVEFVVPIEQSIQHVGPNSILNMYDQKHHVLKDLKTFNPKKAKQVNYKTNNCGHRSDDFVRRNDSVTNILFAGCSNTFGEALPDGQYWPYYVRQSFIDMGYTLGPTQILSYMGGSIDTIIDNIFRYIDSYGKPDYIFMLLPDITRSKDYDISVNHFQIFLEDPNIWSFSVQELKNYLINHFYSYNSKYLLLEILCKQLEIKLISTSWKYEIVGSMAKLHPSTFVSFTNDMSQVFVESGRGEAFLRNVDKDFILESADGLHPGILHNIFYGDIMFEYAKKINVV